MHYKHKKPNYETLRLCPSLLIYLGWWPGLVVARWSRSTKLPYAGPG